MTGRAVTPPPSKVARRNFCRLSRGVHCDDMQNMTGSAPMTLRLMPSVLLTLATAPLLGGCVSTVAKVATAPVRVAGKGVDMMTTSQSEADEKRGRELRRREERLGSLQREYDRHLRECNEGDSRSCLKARDDYAEIQQILPTVPVERR